MHPAIKLICDDITKQDSDAIVNAANSSLMGGGGVDGAIHRAGGPAILAECKEVVARDGRLPTGRAVITTAGNMNAKYVIHTVGPVWRGGNHNEPQLLENAYNSCLKLAVENNLQTISFPSISTGAYRFPIDKAAEIALSTVNNFLQNFKLAQVRFVLFSSGDLQTYQSVSTEQQ